MEQPVIAGTGTSQSRPDPARPGKGVESGAAGHGMSESAPAVGAGPAAGFLGTLAADMALAALLQPGVPYFP